MGRDYELEEKFYTYLESLGVNDAQNALLPAMDILHGKEATDVDYDCPECHDTGYEGGDLVARHKCQFCEEP